MGIDRRSTRRPEPTIDAAKASEERQLAREQAVRERAYAIWEEEGHPDGRDLDHWRRAKKRSAQLTNVPKISGRATLRVRMDIGVTAHAARMDTTPAFALAA